MTYNRSTGVLKGYYAVKSGEIEELCIVQLKDGRNVVFCGLSIQEQKTTLDARSEAPPEDYDNCSGKILMLELCESGELRKICSEKYDKAVRRI